MNYNKCTTCERCVDFCHVRAFKLDEKKIVVNPNVCVIFCRGCEGICPFGAISHPDEGETRKIINKLEHS
ncbi:MAG: 4Fe-4S dicluster domain-containing protein [Candidatus Bathyarchaeia archaeon]